jgi:uncharacterized repeat protein (TIGR03803 family)
MAVTRWRACCSRATHSTEPHKAIPPSRSLPECLSSIPAGTGYTNLHAFNYSTDGAHLWAGLVLSGNTLYGTASGGGSANFPGGTVFRVDTDGAGFVTLRNFDYASGEPFRPRGDLALSGSTLYGTTSEGGSGGWGAVFKVNSDGSGYTVLKNFAGSDGKNPDAGLVLSGDTLYGTTSLGGTGGSGTIFKISTSGTGFTNLWHFAGTNGASPEELVLSGSMLYGTTSAGGLTNSGTVFTINTNGSGFQMLKSFSARVVDPSIGASTNADGSGPSGRLLLSGNTLYGTTSAGGPMGKGVVFAFSLSPAPIPLNIQLMNNVAVLSWSNSSFSLQAASAVSGVYTNLPGATSPYTNSLIAPQSFFRLQAN